MDPKVTTLAQLRMAMEEVRQVAAILYAVKQDELSGQAGQVVGFGTNGRPTPYTLDIDDNGCLIASFADAGG